MKVYIELICDNDIADELMSYPKNRVDIITATDNKSVIEEAGGYGKDDGN